MKFELLICSVRKLIMPFPIVETKFNLFHFISVKKFFRFTLAQFQILTYIFVYKSMTYVHCSVYVLGKMGM